MLSALRIGNFKGDAGRAVRPASDLIGGSFPGIKVMCRKWSPTLFSCDRLLDYAA